jgi:hypothetical protein
LLGRPIPILSQRVQLLTQISGQGAVAEHQRPEDDERRLDQKERDALAEIGDLFRLGSFDIIEVAEETVVRAK